MPQTNSQTGISFFLIHVLIFMIVGLFLRHQLDNTDSEIKLTKQILKNQIIRY